MTTRLGSGMGFAASCTVTNFAADTAAVEVGAGAAETARRRVGPAEAELFVIGGEHGVLAFGGWGEFCGGFSCSCNFGFAVSWEVIWSTVMKTMGVLPLVWRLS